jgi:hypothetical protein
VLFVVRVVNAAVGETDKGFAIQLEVFGLVKLNAVVVAKQVNEPVI